VAVGHTGTILSSLKGKSWTKNKSGTKKNLRGIAYGNGKFVMVGNDGTILASPDLTTWYKRKSGTSQHLRRVFFDVLN